MILKSHLSKSDENPKVKLAQHIIFIAQACQNWSRCDLAHHVVTFEPDALEQKFWHHQIPHGRISLYSKFGQYQPLWTKCSMTPLNNLSYLLRVSWWPGGDHRERSPSVGPCCLLKLSTRQSKDCTTFNNFHFQIKKHWKTGN